MGAGTGLFNLTLEVKKNNNTIFLHRKLGVCKSDCVWRIQKGVRVNCVSRCSFGLWESLVPNG